MSSTMDSAEADDGPGRVYRAQTTEEPAKLVAVKKCHVTDHVEHPRLVHEACALVLLRGHKSIPLAYAWGRSQYYEYLAMEVLSVDLSVLKANLTMRNLAVLAHLTCPGTALDALEYIHSRGIVHCDIKPGNLMLGPDGDQPGRIRVLDFGLCRPYRDHSSSAHLPDKGTPYSIGTLSHLSLTGHLHHSPSRRDDMKSTPYTLLSLMVGRLPWETRKQQRLSSRRIFSLKKQWSGAQLDGDLSLFGSFVDYTRSMAYTEDPAYLCWRDRFRALVPGLSADPLYDPSDCSGPLVNAMITNVDLPEEAYRFEDVDDPRGDTLPQEPDGPPASSSLPQPDGSSGQWAPISEWNWAVPIADDELLGDESKIVSERLDVIDELPEGQRKSLHWLSPPEVMRTAAAAKHKGAIIPKEDVP
ncbi:kinase-like protein [Polyporus arcularius HHB13444]|uniref:non-specific serine/threonine protein kinase n=1 Tax=Polyporus arcularius HHB13444 TaxID=1314778 RepID=A0A5C3PYP5_9APHY|nr:kinase-like protein [Polyporus arcularius HHB13444]